MRFHGFSAQKRWCSDEACCQLRERNKRLSATYASEILFDRCVLSGTVHLMLFPLYTDYILKISLTAVQCIGRRAVNRLSNVLEC